jgi:hypothetical protein
VSKIDAKGSKRWKNKAVPIKVYDFIFELLIFV